MEVVVFGSGLDVEVSRNAVNHDVPAHHAAGPLIVVHSILRVLLADLPRIPEVLSIFFYHIGFDICFRRVPPKQGAAVVWISDQTTETQRGRNKTGQNQTQQQETKQNRTNRNETKRRKKTKRNETKQNETK